MKRQRQRQRESIRGMKKKNDAAFSRLSRTRRKRPSERQLIAGRCHYPAPPLQMPVSSTGSLASDEDVDDDPSAARCSRHLPRSSGGAARCCGGRTLPSSNSGVATTVGASGSCGPPPPPPPPYTSPPNSVPLSASVRPFSPNLVLLTAGC